MQYPAASTVQGGPNDLYFWRMNTWACDVGEESAPGMPPPSDFHVRSGQGVASDLEKQGGAPARQLLQEHGQPRAESREQADVHLLNENGDDEKEELFDVADVPPNTAAWLLYTEPTRLLGNYTQGELSSDFEDCSLPLTPLEDALVSHVYVQAVRPSLRMRQD